MNEQRGVPDAATPVVKQQRTFSFVWLVPLVAILIGSWLVYKAMSEKGPTITITFKSAEGLEAGKTKIKYKDVELGKVVAVDLSSDFSHVTLTVEMVPEAKAYLTEETRFWVVRARVTAGQASGLDTLLSGAYIGIEPGNGGKTKSQFEGLEKQPMVTRDVQGRFFKLSALRLGSLNPGSPIYFRQISVGQVVDYQLLPGGENVDIEIFIEAPYDQFVLENTRFWLASGLDFDLTTDGLRVDTESLMSLLIGGIAFSSFIGEETGPAAEADTVFMLHKTYEEARDQIYKVKYDVIVEFNESVRGLSIGAPVVFRGIQLGTVEDINLEGDFENLVFKIPVLLRLEPERMGLAMVSGEDLIDRWQRLVAKGFRAQLATGNLLTGQLFIDVDFHKNVPQDDLRFRDGVAILPSVPSPTQEVMQGVTGFIKRLDDLPLEDIVRDLQQTLAGVDRLVNGPDIPHAVKSLGRMMTEFENTATSINTETMPQFNVALVEIQKVLNNLDLWVSSDGPLQGDLSKMLQELSAAGRAVSELSDMLERHPEALIQGKRGQ
ncbi:MAG: MlaD family protein [Desulforhopalus sp.]